MNMRFSDCGGVLKVLPGQSGTIDVHLATLPGGHTTTVVK